MKKVFVLFALLLVALTGFTKNVYADKYTDYTEDGDKGAFVVYFNKNGKELNSSFDETSQKELNEYLKGMQPGDEATVDFILRNDYEKEVLWWMKNDALRTFEEDRYSRNSIAGGNYTYKLTYDGNDLYTSDTVGGELDKDDTKTGLDIATNALNTDYDLGMIKPGETKKVTLYFKLDGETQKNNYQDVLGRLQVRFGVEIPEPGQDVIKRYEGEPKYVYVPYTGDSSDLAINLIIELILLNLLLASIWSYIAYRRKQEARS